MRKHFLRSLPIIATLVSFAQIVLSHHSLYAEFDLHKKSSLVGVISHVEWGNPHAWVYLNVADKRSGQATTWAVQLPSPNIFDRLGWKRDAFKMGTTVTVVAYPAKDGSRKGSAIEVASSSAKIYAEGPAPETARSQ